MHGKMPRNIWDKYSHILVYEHVLNNNNNTVAPRIDEPACLNGTAILSVVLFFLNGKYLSEL